mmetsp:Transcript_23001/g.49776  ORF Transcript_23001/g.49776 Transcript_23001/m.49776 type:complete len:87 (-) Transcript_23001:437-697(-)
MLSSARTIHLASSPPLAVLATSLTRPLLTLSATGFREQQEGGLRRVKSKPPAHPSSSGTGANPMSGGSRQSMFSNDNHVCQEARAE